MVRLQPCIPPYAGLVRRNWAFAPYVAVSILHVIILAAGPQELSIVTKVLLMPALLLAFLVALPRRRGEVLVWGAFAIVASWAGDVLLSTPGDIGFIVGLGCFTLAHASYLVLFLRAVREHRIPWLALLYVPWWAALVVILAPHAGALLVPAAAYGIVLGASAAASLGSNRVVGIGGLLFLLSDTLLALRLFYPGFEFWQQDAVIMLGYTAGQGLIIFGVVLHARAHQADVSTTPV